MPILDYFDPKENRVLPLGLMKIYGIDKSTVIPIETIHPTYDHITHTIVAKDIYLNTEGDKYIREFNVVPLPEADVAINQKRDKEEKMGKLRERRNEKLAATDYLVMLDYPISEEDLEAVEAYRQALRDITELEGAPWDGGGELTPWPEEPEIVGTDTFSC